MAPQFQAKFLDPTKRQKSWADSRRLHDELLLKSRNESIRLGCRDTSQCTSITTSSYKALHGQQGSESARKVTPRSSIRLSASCNNDLYESASLTSRFYHNPPQGRNMRAVSALHDNEAVMQKQLAAGKKLNNTKDSEKQKNNIVFGSMPCGYESEHAQQFTPRSIDRCDDGGMVMNKPEHKSKSHFDFGLEQDHWLPTMEAHYVNPQQIQREASTSATAVVPRLKLPMQSREKDMIKCDAEAFSERSWRTDNNLMYSLSSRSARVTEKGKVNTNNSKMNVRRSRDKDHIAIPSYHRDFITTQREGFQDRSADAQEAQVSRNNNDKRASNTASGAISFGTDPMSYATNSKTGSFPTSRSRSKAEGVKDKPARTTSHFILGNGHQKWQTTTEQSFASHCKDKQRLPAVSKAIKPRQSTNILVSGGKPEYEVTSRVDYSKEHSELDTKNQLQISKDSEAIKKKFAQASWSVGSDSNAWKTETAESYLDREKLDGSSELNARVSARLPHFPAKAENKNNISFGSSSGNVMSYQSSMHNAIGPFGDLKVHGKAIMVKPPPESSVFSTRYKPSSEYFSTNTMSAYYRPIDIP